jgi:hypothetical protein
MIGMEWKREGDKLTIEIDLSKTHGRAKSGNTDTVAKTGGFVPVPGRDGGNDPRIILNLNCNQKDA